ncbi:MAG: VWA domain-containing protein [Caldilineaceae bacterium]
MARYWRAQRRLTATPHRYYGTLGVVKNGRPPAFGTAPPYSCTLFWDSALPFSVWRWHGQWPRWSVPRWEGTLVLAFDVSGSMAAEDLEPSRMEAAKAAAIEFIQRQPASIQSRRGCRCRQRLCHSVTDQ